MSERAEIHHKSITMMKKKDSGKQKVLDKIGVPNGI
jgi:hypothetical protein